MIILMINFRVMVLRMMMMMIMVMQMSMMMTMRTITAMTTLRTIKTMTVITGGWWRPRVEGGDRRRDCSKAKRNENAFPKKVKEKRKYDLPTNQ